MSAIKILSDRLTSTQRKHKRGKGGPRTGKRKKSGYVIRYTCRFRIIKRSI